MTDVSASLPHTASSTTVDKDEYGQRQNNNQFPKCTDLNDLCKSDKSLDPLNSISIQKFIDCHQKRRHEYEVNQIKSMYCLSDVSSLDSIMTDVTLRQNSDTILADSNQHQKWDDTLMCSNSVFSVSPSTLPTHRQLGCMCAVPASQHKGMSQASLVSSYELMTRDNFLSPHKKRKVSVVSVGCQAPDEQSLLEFYAFKSTQVNFPSIENIPITQNKCCSLSNAKLSNMKTSVFSEKTLTSPSLHYFSKSNGGAQCDKMLPSTKIPVLERSPRQKSVRKSVKTCGSLEHVCNDRASTKVNKPQQQQQCNYVLLDQHFSHKKESSTRNSPELHSAHANRKLIVKSWQKASLRPFNGKQQLHRFCKDPESLNKQSFVSKRMLSERTPHKAADCGVTSQHTLHKAADCGMNSQHTPLNAGDCGSDKNAASKCRIQQSVCGAVPAVGQRLFMQHPYMRAPPAKLRPAVQHRTQASTIYANKEDLAQHKKPFSSKQNSEHYFLPGKHNYRARSSMCIRSSQNTDSLSVKEQHFIPLPLVKRSLSLYDETKLDTSKDLAETKNKCNYSEEHTPYLLNLSFWKNIVQVFKSAYSTASGLACQHRTAPFSYGSQVDAPDCVCFLEGKESSFPAGCIRPQLDQNISYSYPRFYNPTGSRKVTNTRSRFGGYLKTKQVSKKLKEIEGNVNSKPSEATVTFVGMYNDLQFLKQGLRPLFSKNNLDTEVKCSYLPNSSMNPTAGEGRGYKQLEDTKTIKPATCKSVPHDNVSQSQVCTSTCNMKLINRSLSSGTPFRASPQPLFIVRSPIDKQLSPNSRCTKRKGSTKHLPSKQRFQSSLSSVRAFRSLSVAADRDSMPEHSFSSRQK